MAVAAFPVVQHLDVIEHIRPSAILRLIDRFTDPLVLQ